MLLQGELMHARQIPTRSLVALLLCLLSVRISVAEETSPRTEIEKLGGSVLSIGDQYEVDFHLRGRELTDVGLVHVADLKTVIWLNLRGTHGTDEGLRHLRGLDQLRALHLEETAVGDEGIAHLSSLPNLEYLNLYGTNVTDQGLKSLASVRSLKRLYVWKTEVTDDGVAQLAKALPELRIEQGVDLSKLPAVFPQEEAKPKPKVALEWVPVTNRSAAPERSESGINSQILFENKSKQTVKLYWISYGAGELKLYGTLAPGATREQNSYASNAWLVTDENDQPLGYFIVKEDDSHAVVPAT